VNKFKLGMEKPPLLSRGGKNSRRQNRRELQNYEAFLRVPPSDAGNLKITLEKQKASPFGSAQVQFPAGNGESSAFFGGVNFSLPGTWQGFSIFHSLNLFTASGGNGGISADPLAQTEIKRNRVAFSKKLKYHGNSFLGAG
jgi:hypothetical protein